MPSTPRLTTLLKELFEDLAEKYGTGNRRFASIRESQDDQPISYTFEDLGPMEPLIGQNLALAFAQPSEDKQTLELWHYRNDGSGALRPFEVIKFVSLPQKLKDIQNGIERVQQIYIHFRSGPYAIHGPNMPMILFLLREVWELSNDPSCIINAYKNEED